MKKNMSLINLNVKKIFGWTFILVINYFIFFYLIYVLSAILLVNSIIPNIKLINEYQRNYYNIGYRNIWQSQSECIEFSDKQIFVPKKTSCNFNNVEFKTIVSFDEFGRSSDHPINDDRNGIAVLGNSFAMGWGVNDKETFSYLLEQKINRPVYNLGVAGYGAIRSLIRFQEFNLLDKVNTVIIQYSYTDYGENVGYKKTNIETAKKKFNLVKEGVKFSIWKKLRKSFRYSITIPKDIFTKKESTMTFDHHNKAFIKVLKKFPFLKDKRIIVFYVNGYQQEFNNFPSGKSEIFDNLEYIDLDIEKNSENFYLIDGHLNSIGHTRVANKLSKLF